MEEMITPEELSKFLVRAKRQTYASGKKAKLLEDDLKEFTFKEGILTYRDRYHAKDPRPFGGEEIVFENEKAIWMMNYYGFTISDEIDSRPVYAFLRKAMSIVDEKMPFRGPTEFKEGLFVYKNEVEGNIERFNGTEIILFKGETVYQLRYHGGRL